MRGRRTDLSHGIGLDTSRHGGEAATGLNTEGDGGDDGDDEDDEDENDEDENKDGDGQGADGGRALRGREDRRLEGDCNECWGP